MESHRRVLRRAADERIPYGFRKPTRLSLHQWLPLHERGISVVQEGDNPYQVSSVCSEPPVLDLPVSFPRRALLGSLAVMLPWPLLGIVACMVLSLFEEAGEAIFMFGSVTMIILMPLALVVSSEWIFGVLSGMVWLSVLALPRCFPKKSLHPRFHVELVLVCQALFSAIQAGLGFLVVLGKQC